VRLKQRPANPTEDARVGLAGPVWGVAAGLGFFGLHLAFASPLQAALGHVAAYINLFNLLPVWQLDGARGFAALTKRDRLLAAAAMVAAWLLSGETLLLLVAAVAAFRAFDKAAPPGSDRTTLVTWLGLTAVLTLLLVLTPAARVGASQLSGADTNTQGHAALQMPASSSRM
jgi:Zn-dependent protease